MRRTNKRNWTEIRRKINSVVKRICDERRDQVTKASEIIDLSMKRLRLPMDNPEAVYLMREGLRFLENAAMRREASLRSVPDEESDQLVFWETIQDKYVVLRSNEYCQVPRLQLQPFEKWDIIRRLRKIGGKYMKHADEFQKETESISGPEQSFGKSA